MVGMTFVDIEKFYASPEIDLLVPDAVELQMPLGVISMSLAVHCSPRVLPQGKALSESAVVCDSLLAGNFASTSLARAFLYKVLQAAYDGIAPPPAHFASSWTTSPQGCKARSRRWPLPQAGWRVTFSNRLWGG